MTVTVVALVTYANTLPHGFVFDDIDTIVENRWIRSPGHLLAIFATHVAGFDPEFAANYYRPMMHTLYMATYAVAGLQPFSFHLVNVVLHALVTLLGFFVARALLTRLAPATSGSLRSWTAIPVVTGLLFATHPVHSEAVAWLAGITDLSFSAFGMLCVLTYVRAWHPRGSVVAAAWLVLACFSKETALAVVLVLAAVEVAQVLARRSPVAGAASRMAPLALAVVVYLAARWAALGGLAPNDGPHRYDAFTSVLAAVQLFGAYVKMLVIPVPLNALHVFHPPASLLASGVLLGLAAVGVFVAAVWFARHRPVPLVALVWTAAPLLPVLYTRVLGDVVFAERYLYFPSFGFTLLLACLWSAGTERLGRWHTVSRNTLVAAPLVVVVAYGAGTVWRNPVWRDHLSLWSDAVRKSPGSAAAHEYLGFALYDAGRLTEAAESCRRALALDPTRVDARINLGNALAALGDFGGAAQALDEALRQQPRSVQALTTRGLVYMATGQPDLALESYRTALGFDPNSAEAHNVLGVALARLGRVEDAVRELREAVRLAPDRPEYRDNVRVLTTPSSVSPR